MTTTRFWAVDKVVLAYFAAAVIVILGWWSQIPYAPALLAGSLLGGAGRLADLLNADSSQSRGAKERRKFLFPLAPLRLCARVSPGGLR